MTQGDLQPPAIAGSRGKEKNWNGRRQEEGRYSRLTLEATDILPPRFYRLLKAL